MSARGYALHIVCPQLSFSNAYHWALVINLILTLSCFIDSGTVIIRSTCEASLSANIHRATIRIIIIVLCGEWSLVINAMDLAASS